MFLSLYFSEVFIKVITAFKCKIFFGAIKRSFHSSIEKEKTAKY